MGSWWGLCQHLVSLRWTGNISVDFIFFHVDQPDYNDSALQGIDSCPPVPACACNIYVTMISFALMLGHYLELAFYFHFQFSPSSLPNCVQTKVCTSLKPCQSQKGDSGIGETGLEGVGREGHQPKVYPHWNFGSSNWGSIFAGDCLF